jgi:hypothetical protein
MAFFLAEGSFFLYWFLTDVEINAIGPENQFL